MTATVNQANPMNQVNQVNPVHPKAAPRSIEDTVDVLAVTDTVFHDLAHSAPLTAALLDRILPRVDGQDDRTVLLVGPNVALAQNLLDHGVDIELWHVPGVAITEELRPLVTNVGSCNELLTGDHCSDPNRTYDVIVLPHVLDGIDGNPVDALRCCRAMLAPSGSVVVANRRAAALSVRLRSLRGGSPLPEPMVADARHSWSWPIQPPRRLVDNAAMQAWARQAGLRCVRPEPIVDTTALVEVNAAPISEWLGAKLSSGVRRLVPSLRETTVVDLVPLDAGRSEIGLGGDPATFPSVTIIVDATAPEATARLIGQIHEQTYPRERIDVIVSHRWPADAAEDSPNSTTLENPTTLDNPENRENLRRLGLSGTPIPVWLVEEPTPGPDAINRAVARSTSDIVALTDDRCNVPAGWVESGVRSMGGNVAALGGGVLADDGSAAPFLALPGRRRSGGGDGVFDPANSFFVRNALEQVGGFDDRYQAADSGRWGWATTAATRLRAEGFTVAEDPTAFVFKHHPFPSDRSWLQEEFTFASQLPMALPDTPALRSTALHHRWFASERTLAFDMALASAAVAAKRRNPAWLIAGAVPWIRSASEYVDVWPPTEWPTSSRHVRGMLLRNLAWLSGLVRGSLRARRLVL